jgi:hypothetical protein
LRALRAWDPYVFGRKPPARPTSYTQFQQQQQEGYKEPPKNPNDKRPEETHRVILLAGPPGVGTFLRLQSYRPLRTLNVLVQLTFFLFLLFQMRIRQDYLGPYCGPSCRLSTHGGERIR